MDRGGVGRVLVASLHQGISDLMPTRLDFYENWLNAAGMRNGKIGLAPLAAVLSFLRQEGDPYTLVTERAGEYAAQWTFDNLSGMQRSFIRSLPVPLRARMAMRLAKSVVHKTYRGSRGITKLRKGQGTLTLRSSVFCTVREPFEWPLCVYYSAALSRLLKLVEVDGTARVGSCLGVGDHACVIAVTMPQNQK
jgi:hypothetical protein